MKGKSYRMSRAQIIDSQFVTTQQKTESSYGTEATLVYYRVSRNFKLG